MQKTRQLQDPKLVAIGFGTTSNRALIRRFCKLFACLVAR